MCVIIQWKSNFSFHSKDKNVYHSTLVILDISKTTGVKWMVSYTKSTDDAKKVTRVSMRNTIAPGMLFINVIMLQCA